MSAATFVPITKTGRHVVRRMTEQAVWMNLDTRRLRAGVAPLSPHDVRQTFVGGLLDASADILGTPRGRGVPRARVCMHRDVA